MESASLLFPFSGYDHADLQGRHEEQRSVRDSIDALTVPERVRGGLAGAALHTDHGAPYTSGAFADACHKARVRPAMSTVGSGADNARAESFDGVQTRDAARPQDRSGEREAHLDPSRRLRRCRTRCRHSSLFGSYRAFPCAARSVPAFTNEARLGAGLGLVSLSTVERYGSADALPVVDGSQNERGNRGVAQSPPPRSCFAQHVEGAVPAGKQPSSGPGGRVPASWRLPLRSLEMAGRVRVGNLIRTRPLTSRRSPPAAQALYASARAGRRAVRGAPVRGCDFGEAQEAAPEQVGGGVQEVASEVKPGRMAREDTLHRVPRIPRTAGSHGATEQRSNGTSRTRAPVVSSTAGAQAQRRKGAQGRPSAPAAPRHQRAAPPGRSARHPRFARPMLRKDQLATRRPRRTIRFT